MKDDKETRARFGSIMLGVAENYGQTLTAEGGALRFRALMAYELHDIEAAAMSIICSRKYTSMPTVADFLEHLGGGSVEDKAQVEAGKVLRAVCEVGPYRSVVFDDPVTQAVIRQNYGGWPKLCEDCGQEESEKWFLHNFAKSYAAYKRTGASHYGVLPGLHEIQNGANGFLDRYPSVPRLIGDPQKAEQVRLQGSSDHVEGVRALGECLRSRQMPDAVGIEQ